MPRRAQPDRVSRIAAAGNVLPLFAAGAAVIDRKIIGRRHPSGDFLFSTFGGSKQIIAVSGFEVPPVPVPAAVYLFSSAIAGLVGFRKKGRRTARASSNS